MPPTRPLATLSHLMGEGRGEGKAGTGNRSGLFVGEAAPAGGGP